MSNHDTYTCPRCGGLWHSYPEVCPKRMATMSDHDTTQQALEDEIRKRVIITCRYRGADKPLPQILPLVNDTTILIVQAAQRYALEQQKLALHKIELCLIGKYAGDPIVNALEAIKELNANK